MAFVKQFLTKTRPSENTSMFRYSPALPVGQLEIYCLISISNMVEVETSRFNKFVWDGFLDGFLTKDDEIIARLKNALVASEFKLKELIRHERALEEKGVDLNLSVLIFKGNKVFVGILGEHKVLFFKKKIVDLSELLIKSKSTVGSTIISEADFFVVFHSGKILKKQISELNEIGRIESVLDEFFEKEDAFGGAFVAKLKEEKKARAVVLEPIVQEVENKSVPDTEVEEIQTKASDKKEGVKRTVCLVLAKLKVWFDKLVVFLSVKLSKLFEKFKSVLRNKYGRRRWYKKLQSSSSIRRLSQGFKPFKIDEYKDKELRMRRFVALFVILVLIFSVFFGVRSAFESRLRSSLAKELNVLMEEWDSSLAKADQKAWDNSEEALNIVSKVSKELNEHIDDLKEIDNFDRLNSESREKIDELDRRISEIKDKSRRIVGLDEEKNNIRVFMDTKVEFGDKSNPVSFVISKGSQIVGGEFLYLIDAGEKAVYAISLKTGTYEKVSDPKGFLKKPVYIDLGNNPENVGLYVYDAESGALRAGKDQEGKFNNFLNLSGLTPRVLGGDGVTGFAVFGPSDFLNFLVPAESRIIRAVNFGGISYNLPSGYISHPSFEKGTDLFGDLYVYVLSTTPNGIKRFVPQTGLNSQLKVSGLEKDLNSITMGYTGSTMDRTLVVFDSEIKKFIQFTKPIERGENLVHPGEIVLKWQYEYRGTRSDVFQEVKDVVITNNEQFMYVLDGTKIWEINLEK